MIYYVALVAVTLGALLNRGAFPYALVLCLVWAAFCVLERLGLSSAYPWVDCASIYPLTYLAFRNPKWWSLTIVGLCFVTVLSHLVFWTAYYANVYLGEEYKTALRTLFLLSMATALLGNTNVKRLVGLLVERMLGLLRGAPAVGFARRSDVSHGAKEALSDQTRSGVLRFIQPSHSRLVSGMFGHFSNWRVGTVARQKKAP